MNTEIYNESIKNYYNRLLRFVLKNIGDLDAAKDIVQDCFLKLWENKNKIDNTKIKAWLFAVAHNSMINYIKKRQKSVGLNDMELLEHSTAQDFAFENKELIDQALETLTYIQKSAIILKDLEGYDYKEIGEILNLSMEQVKVYIFRGRKNLKKYLTSIKVTL